MAIIDSATKIREGEELNISALSTFLKEKIPDLDGDLQVEQYPSGFSNLTYQLTVGDRKMVLRRPPFGKKAKSAHDMGREFRVLSSLKPSFSYCPKPLVYNENESILGAPFYVMDHLEGIIFRKDLPKELTVDAESMRNLSKSLIDVHLQLHSIDYEAIGLQDLGKPEGYIQRQVEGWSKRYIAAKTEDAPSFEKVMQWLHDKMPKESSKTSIIHNDYKFDNVIWNAPNPTEIIGVLDWEMTTLGDPLMDLGSSLAYWVEKNDPDHLKIIRTLPTNVDGAMSRQEIIDYYAEQSGIKIDNFDFYYCFGLFRLAVIAQQIYYRFFHKQTKDERFGRLIFGVHGLEQGANELIEKSDL